MTAPKTSQKVKNAIIGGGIRQESSSGSDQEVDNVIVAAAVDQRDNSTHLNLQGVGSASGKAAIIGLTVAGIIAVIAYAALN